VKNGGRLRGKTQKWEEDGMDEERAHEEREEDVG
jgi:hypothetical protein